MASVNNVRLENSNKPENYSISLQVVWAYAINGHVVVARKIHLNSRRKKIATEK